jgi:hypothetical protein
MLKQKWPSVVGFTRHTAPWDWDWQHRSSPVLCTATKPQPESLWVLPCMQGSGLVGSRSALLRAPSLPLRRAHNVAAGDGAKVVHLRSRQVITHVK